MIMNNRYDRLPRIAEMAALIAQEIRPSVVFRVGESGDWLRAALPAQVPKSLVVDLTRAGDARLALDRIAAECREGAHLFGIGNTRGAGKASQTTP